MNNKSYQEIQKQLFDNVQIKFKNRAAAISDYRKNFPCSESTAQEHFRGMTAITYEQGMKIAKHYHLHDTDIWPSGWDQTHFWGIQSSIDPDLFAYSTTFNSGFDSLNRFPNAHIYAVLNNIPIFLVHKYKSLAGILFYFHQMYVVKDPHIRSIQFGSNFLKRDEINRWSNECRSTFLGWQKASGTEFWTPRMFNGLLSIIEVIQKNQDIAPDGTYDLICDQINHLLEDMVKMVSTGQKVSCNSLRNAH